MAVFGRLDVYFPDGRIETYPLEGDTISIGRAEGNTIALDTETISRYHFSITNKDNVIQLTDLDSANGTYIDGTPLQSNEPYLLDDIEEIQIGHLRIIYHPGSDSPTIPIAPTDDSTQPTDLGFRVSLERSEFDVWPASSSSVEIAITNSTQEDTQFQVVATGLPDTWAKINRPQLLIDGLDTSYVLLNVKPTRRTDLPPKKYLVAIKVSPVDEPEKFIELALTVNLKGFSGFGVALSPENIGTEDELHLYLLNQGNEPLALTVSGQDKSGTLAFDLPTGTVQLAAGQRSQIKGKVQPQKRPLIGKAVVQPFALVVKAQTNSAYVAAVPGKVRIEPSLSTWMLASIGGIVASILLVALVLLSQTPDPKIDTFSISETQVAQGTPIALNWEASDVQSFDIEINGQVAVSNLSGEATAYTLDTTDYDNEINIALVAKNGDQRVKTQGDVDIYVPVTVIDVSIQPDEIKRYMIQSVVVSWELNGSVVTRLSVSETFSGNPPLEPDYEAIDSETLTGIPLGDFTITLFAEDEIGTTYEEVITVTTINPECTPKDNDVVLYAGPDTLFSQVGVAPNQLPVVVSGYDESGQWIRAELPSGTQGWGYGESFACPEDINQNTLQPIPASDLPPLPSLTPTLPNTPTSIPTQTLIPSPTNTPSASPAPTQTPRS